MKMVIRQLLVQRNSLLSIYLCLIMFFVTGQAAGTTVFSKPNNPTQWVIWSDIEGLQGGTQQTADNFRLSSNEIVSSVEWFGGYYNLSDNVPTSRSFTIRIFVDSGGVPANVPFFEETVTTTGIDTSTDSSFRGRDIFKYSAFITPVSLTMGTDYWISILESDPITSYWFWQASDFVSGEYIAARPSELDNWITVSDNNRNELAFSFSATSVIPILIDIKPGSNPNCFNNNGNGVIPVAILSDLDFDATQVDPTTVSLNGQAVRVVGKGNTQAHIEDADGDGLDDLVVQIEDVDGTYEEGDTIATLTGETFDSKLIEGTDSICIVP